jgi:LemA protein
MTTFIILAALIVVTAFWLMTSYNSFVRLKAIVDEAWSGIKVQLKRRYDLIPNLVATVKQYSLHEKTVLETVAQMRSASMNATGVADKAAAEAGLTGALKTLFAVAENYPDLKANQNFLELQKELMKLEEEIQLSRRYYNGAARNYNIMVQSFPSKIVASSTGFEKAPFFDLDSPSEAQAPKVEF